MNHKPKTCKKKLWLLKVPKQLDREIREYIREYDISLANFVRKSVSYLTEDETPEPTKHKCVTWLIQAHPSLDKAMRNLAKANYPCMSSLIRYAVFRKIIQERLDAEHHKFNRSQLDEIYKLRKAIRKLAKLYKIRNKDLVDLGVAN